MKSLVKDGVRKMLHAPAREVLTMAAQLLRRSIVSPEEARAIFAAQGFHVLRQSYYLPIPDPADLPPGFFEQESALVGVDMNEGEALRLLDQVFPPYLEEFRAHFPIEKSGAGGFHLLNGAFMAVDAHVYYSFIRKFAPKRIIEVGVGNSTLVALEANARNEREGLGRAHLTAIDPYPPAYLRGAAGIDRLVVERVQRIPLAEFEALEAGDILFIDSSHAVRAGGDVQFEFLEILPRLKDGVVVHIHDISLPRPYPRTYFDNQVFWSEQDILQAFLAFNKRFEVLWPGNYMSLRHGARLAAAFPEIAAMRAKYPSSEPASFWMRVAKG